MDKGGQMKLKDLNVLPKKKCKDTSCYAGMEISKGDMENLVHDRLVDELGEIEMDGAFEKWAREGGYDGTTKRDSGGCFVGGWAC